MLTNIIEFKDFLNYFQSIYSASLSSKEQVKIYFSYNDDELTLRFVSDSGYSFDKFRCSKNLYNEIVQLLYASFISSNKMILASKVNGSYIVKSSNGEMISEIDDTLSEKISLQVFDKIKNRNESKNEGKPLSEFEQISNFFGVYCSFLKRCVKKSNPSEITTSYKNGVYLITITNNGKTIFSKSVVCSKFKAQYLDKVICENLIDENSIVLSSITGNNHLKIQTPKLCLLMPYNNNLEKYHNEALEKMNEYSSQFSMQKVKSSNR